MLIGLTRLNENNRRNFFVYSNCELLDFEWDEVDEDHEGCEGFTRVAFEQKLNCY